MGGKKILKMAGLGNDYVKVIERKKERKRRNE